MKVIGIVSEYNPFHNGHAYQIARSRELIADNDDAAVICVMSGNAVQRGDISLADKHSRAKMALEGDGGQGRCDLVIELPAVYSLSSAEGFARSAVYLLNACGVVTHLSFGSECGDIELLERIADADISRKADSLLKENLKRGLSYPAARQASLKSLIGSDADALSSPNNILGIEYIKALSVYDSGMKPVTIKRFGAGHNDPAFSGNTASASLIRHLILSGNFDKAYRFMPVPAAKTLAKLILEHNAPASIARLDRMIIYRLRTMELEDYLRLQDTDGDLASRLFSASRSASTAEDFLSLVKTKRYVHSRLRRIVLRALLCMEDPIPAAPYIRILGFNQTGRALLKQMKKKASLPIITKPSHIKKLNTEAQDIFLKDVLLTDIFSLCVPEKHNFGFGREWRTSPVSVE